LTQNNDAGNTEEACKNIADAISATAKTQGQTVSAAFLVLRMSHPKSFQLQH